MIIDEKLERVCMAFWRQVAVDSEFVCNVCHHFHELFANDITMKMPVCLLAVLQNRCRFETDGNVPDESLKTSTLLPEKSGENENY